MARGNTGNVLGSWAFLIGLILAIILGVGLIDKSPNWTIALVIIGLIIGLLNIGVTETTPFLISGAVLIIASSLGQGLFTTLGEGTVKNVLEGVLNALLAIFVPATIIVAIKNVFSLARR
ncbi:MAG: hypothetical protein Q7S27_02835 [Nanoarchaeota archaeon]|nr:hypothetical protein [Nanoarchaeota archaeon]